MCGARKEKRIITNIEVKNRRETMREVGNNRQGKRRNKKKITVSESIQKKSQNILDDYRKE